MLESARPSLLQDILLGLAGYALGLVLSALFDLPTGAMIVWSLAALAIIWMVLQHRSSPRPGEA